MQTTSFLSLCVARDLMGILKRIDICLTTICGMSFGVANGHMKNAYMGYLNLLSAAKIIYALVVG
jgi:hypothetical protein